MNKEHAENIKSLFQKAVDAFKKGNFDYAVELFKNVLEHNPDHTEARHYLRVSERARLNQKPQSSVSSIFKKFSSSITSVKAKILEHKGQTGEAIKQYEKALRANPNDEKTLQKLASCLVSLNMTEAAIETLKEIRGLNPNNTEAIKKLGHLYLGKESYPEARDCFEKILRLKPNDLDAEQSLKNLAALGTIKRGGWERETSFREKVLDKTQTERLEKQDRSVKSDTDINFLIEQVKQELAEGRETPSNFRKLSELQIKAGWLEKAIETYQKLKEKNPSDTKVEDEIINLKSKIIDNKIEAEKDNEKIPQLQKQKEELHLAALQKRVLLFPNDLNLRYTYGSALYESSQIDEAISHLQAAVNEPSKKTESLNLLGLIFKQKKMLDLALAQFDQAFQSLPKNSRQTPLEKDILYNLAQTHEAMGKTDLAIEEYKKIYTSDITYKDVAKKIEDFYRGKS